MSRQTKKHPSPRARFTHMDVAREMDAIAPKDDGSKYSPEYVGRIRRGYTISPELSLIIDAAVQRLIKRGADSNFVLNKKPATTSR